MKKIPEAHTSVSSDLRTESRRRFLAAVSGLSATSTLLPGVLWAQAVQSGSENIITPAMLKAAATLSGMQFTDEQLQAMVRAVNQNLDRINTLHAINIPNNVSPPFYFSPLVPGMEVNRTAAPLRFSKPAKVTRPANLEDVAFWPITHLAQLIKSRQVTSLELTQMYLARLHRYNEKLNCVVTFLDDVALTQAREADAEIAAGKYKGALHGIPWGAKDIISVKGYKTTWGSGAYQDQVFDEDASVVEKLRHAGAVLLAKLTTGELAGGDRWFGGRTNNPWKLDEGASGSSAGSASATAAGLVPFGIGTETGGSIISPSARCGATGLRPTFGRVSRYGVMALSWTQDRLGPICRYVEDCAVVMEAIAHPDGRDLSVTELPFQYDATLDVRKLRVGYFADAFDDADRLPDWKQNDKATLERLRQMGYELIPLSVPEFPIDVLSLSVEAAVFFDELTRSGRDQLLTNKERGERFRSGRMIPAVEYLQSQRLRSMMMQELAKTTANVDVYLAPSTNGNPRAPEGAPPPNPAPPPNKTQQHYQMANLACYPAVALPNGFSSNGTPTSMIFMARPYGEAQLLSFAKAYQDATGFNLKHPVL
jgi:Asp-tRNA(Asn)/Glu-tRNA(Gln) amidotransferase A subunit family amidase